MADVHETVQKKLNEGWIKVWMMIEAMAVSDEAVKSALEKHVEKMEKEKNFIVYKKEFGNVEKIQKPLPNIKEGYSCVVELECLSQNFERLIYIVLNYGPSAIEILEPQKIEMDTGEAQSIVNTIAGLLHRFAATAGGIIVAT
jgi:hypothetical protein